MSRKRNIYQDRQSGFKIRVQQENQPMQSLFSQFHNDLKISNDSSIQDNYNLLSTTTKLQSKTSRTKSQDKKRMKLIDYIYIKNTSKKNQKSSKIEKATMTVNELKKSRMKEGKEKAFKSIVQEMIEQFKLISIKASAMSEMISQSVTYTGSTDEIAKLCNIRRILKDNILKNMDQVQRLMGVQNNAMDVMSRQKINEEEEEELDEKLKRLQFLGVQRLDDEVENEGLSPKLKSRGSGKKLKVENKLSNKDTWISERDSQRDDR